jgi:hypothetical protein
MNPSLPESGSHHARLTLSAAQSIHAVRGWDRESEYATASNHLLGIRPTKHHKVDVIAICRNPSVGCRTSRLPRQPDAGVVENVTGARARGPQFGRPCCRSVVHGDVERRSAIRTPHNRTCGERQHNRDCDNRRLHDADRA